MYSGSLISDRDILAALAEYEATLSRNTTTLLPLPGWYRDRPAWHLAAVEVADTVNGERLGPVCGLRVVMADTGDVADIPYEGPLTTADGDPGGRALRARMRVVIPDAGEAFFRGAPADGAWMRVALRAFFPGGLWTVLISLAPDFIRWLAATPDDQADPAG